MRSLAYVLIAALTISGVATAEDAAGADEWGNTPDCSADGTNRVSTNTAPITANGGPRFCEGEHWEGEDEASADRGCGDTVSANTISTANCGNGRSSQGEDSSEAGEVGIRVSQGSGAYTSAQIGGVGQANVYASNDGLVAVFLQDYSDSLGFTCIAFQANDCNMLAEIVHLAGITQGQAEEEEPECSVAQYSAQACPRDNTAVTVDAR